MDVLLSGRELAIRAEWTDTLNWLDQQEAAPLEVMAGLQLEHRRVGELVMVAAPCPSAASTWC